MDQKQAILILIASSIVDMIGVLTLITNEGMFIPKIDLGFSIPSILPVEIQGFGLMIAGGITAVFAAKSVQ